MYQYNAVIDNVVDGDTIDALIDLGFKICTKHRLRLARVDTPEKGQPGYAMAKDFVREVCGGKTVKVTTEKVSKFGYYLAEVTLEDGRNLSDMLIGTKLAVPYDGGKK
jgi:micrococcal nuclease